MEKEDLRAHVQLPFLFGPKTKRKGDKRKKHLSGSRYQQGQEPLQVISELGEMPACVLLLQRYLKKTNQSKWDEYGARKELRFQLLLIHLGEKGSLQGCRRPADQ